MNTAELQVCRVSSYERRSYNNSRRARQKLLIRDQDSLGVGLFISVTFCLITSILVARRI
jgi:hypothetical protein